MEQACILKSKSAEIGYWDQALKNNDTLIKSSELMYGPRNGIFEIWLFNYSIKYLYYNNLY